MHAAGLDESVNTAVDHLREDGAPPPDVVLLLGTGRGALAGQLAGGGARALADVPGTPEIWREGELIHGRLAGAEFWLIEDAPGDLEFGEGGPPSPAWERGWPVWLAAAAGAQVAVVTAAGGSVAETVPAASLCALRDHLNLSGETPLLGLGETSLGPLFPDQSLVHHDGLRAAARGHAERRGLPLVESIGACVAGPALTTPAERRWIRTAGADVFVQGLAGPLLACAHAGLTTVTLVAVTEADDGPMRMSDLVARAEELAPALEDLVVALGPDLAETAAELAEDFA